MKAGLIPAECRYCIPRTPPWTPLRVSFAELEIPSSKGGKPMYLCYNQLCGWFFVCLAHEVVARLPETGTVGQAGRESTCRIERSEMRKLRSGLLKYFRR